MAEKPRNTPLASRIIGYPPMRLVSHAHEGLSWIPYDVFCHLRDNNHDHHPVHLNLSSYGVDRDFWMILPPEDSGLSKQLTTFGFREPLNCRYYVKFVTPNDSVLDIGSNVGFFVLLGSNARRMTCVEPQAQLIEMLKENIRRNKLTEKCEVLQEAVGPKGKLHLEICPQMNLSKIVGESSKNSVDVDSEPLEDLVQKHPSNLIRLDTEGFEYEILYNQIPEAINKISMEFHTDLLGPEKSDKLLQYFKDEGFKVKYLIEDVPLRLYPFMSLLKRPELFGFISYVRKNVAIDDAVDPIHWGRGRGLKYLYLQRGNGHKTG